MKTQRLRPTSLLAGLAPMLACSTALVAHAAAPPVPNPCTLVTVAEMQQIVGPLTGTPRATDPASGETRSWEVPDIVGSMAIRTGGGAILALANGVHTFDFETCECRMLATSPDLNEQVQLADGKVDRRGRFIVGFSDRGMKEARGKLDTLDPGASELRPIDDDIFLTNGPCWSPDDRTFCHADSIRKTIYADDHDIERGTLANRRPQAALRTAASAAFRKISCSRR